jgi:hypothetical protein
MIFSLFVGRFGSLSRRCRMGKNRPKFYRASAAGRRSETIDRSANRTSYDSPAGCVGSSGMGLERRRDAFRDRPAGSRSPHPVRSTEGEPAPDLIRGGAKRRRGAAACAK